ncbi:hypothetical protein SDC9_82294 [bioreactor metagenome]|uniref:Uncharacterized protein n=1 Tax=bioreactor metagenome TaxID=1076179 RepID=A0A644Z6T0_9ZZZZ
MALAVAKTKTAAVFSCIQVKKVPKTRAVTPESPLPLLPASPFSISSIHKIHGAMASAVCMALRIFSSDEPTIPAKIFPMSRRNRGNFHKAEAAFAVKLLPQPGMPVIRTPFGAGKPNDFASSVKERPRLRSHSFRFSNPPTDSIPSVMG